jgi:hypothetical protein
MFSSRSTVSSTTLPSRHFEKLATDIFGRGIDVERVNIVMNYDCPPNADSYLHRVGYALSQRVNYYLNVYLLGKLDVLEPKDLPSRLCLLMQTNKRWVLFNLDLKSLYRNSPIILILPVTLSVIGIQVPGGSPSAGIGFGATVMFNHDVICRTIFGSDSHASNVYILVRDIPKGCLGVFDILRAPLSLVCCRAPFPFPQLCSLFELRVLDDRASE